MLADFLRLLLRRWALSLLALVVALAGAGAALVLVTPLHRSEASVLFVPPNQDATVKGTINPFLALGGSLSVVPSVLQATVTDDRTSKTLLDAGHEGVYTVVVDFAQNAAPILLITVDSRSASDSVGTMNAVVDQISNQLAALQKARAVDPRYLIDYTVLTTTPTPLVVRTGQIQAAALVAIVLLVLGTALIGLVSRAPNRSPGRRRAKAADPESDHRLTPPRWDRDLDLSEAPPAPHHGHGAVPRIAIDPESESERRLQNEVAFAPQHPAPPHPAQASPAPPSTAPLSAAEGEEQALRVVTVRVTPPGAGPGRTPARRRSQQIARPVRPVGSTHEPVGSGRGSSVDGRP